MDRKMYYAGQIPLSAQFLQAERNIMVGLGYLAEAVFGTPTLVDGLLCTGMTPASLTIQVGPGSVWELSAIDSVTYGSLASDNSHLIMKQGINVDVQTFTLIGPGTAGQSVNYLIQARLLEQDGDNTVLPYVNSANPAVPFTGPNNSGTAQPTTRKCTVLLSAKAGVAATTGSQVDPAPDAGYVGLYRVTVPYGATTLDNSNITQLTTAPFLFKKLPQIPSWTQSGAFLWGDDTGSANAIVANLTPVPTQYTKGMHVFVRKVGSASTGNVTANFNGLGAVAVLDTTGAQIGAGNMTAGMVLHLCYDGTAFRWINGNITNTSISSIAASSGEGISVGGASPYPVSLNFPGLSADSPTALDLFAFYDNEAGHHKVIDWQGLLNLIRPSASGLLNAQAFTASGTYNKTPGATKALVFVTGGGAGGGMHVCCAGGGGAGATAIALVDVSALSSVAVTVGAGGLGVNAAFSGSSNGGDGSASSFGSYAVAGGGLGCPGLAKGGLGGTASVGLMQIPGGDGHTTFYNVVGAGNGGASFWGGGGRGASQDDTGNGSGINARCYGGGGGGGDSGISAGKGGDGKSGVVLILEI